MIENLFLFSWLILVSFLLALIIDNVLHSNRLNRPNQQSDIVARQRRRHGRLMKDVALLPNGEVNTQNRALHVSLYAKFLSRWLHVFPRRQLHIVDGGMSISYYYKAQRDNNHTSIYLNWLYFFFIWFIINVFLNPHPFLIGLNRSADSGPVAGTAKSRTLSRLGSRDSSWSVLFQRHQRFLLFERYRWRPQRQWQRRRFNNAFTTDCSSSPQMPGR